jgi:hypothetical protein
MKPSGQELKALAAIAKQSGKLFKLRLELFVARCKIGTSSMMCARISIANLSQAMPSTAGPRFCRSACSSLVAAGSFYDPIGARQMEQLEANDLKHRMVFLSWERLPVISLPSAIRRDLQ